MLDGITDDDVKRISKSLGLTKEGKSVEILTKEEYDKQTKWQKFDDEGSVIVVGGVFYT